MKLFIKRFLLVIFGIILSLVILECGLRLAGWTISSFQQYKNNKALRNKSQYTIMCLGESTTQGQYPVQLQQILDIKYPNKFSIIDCGLGSSRIETILNYLDNNINKYKPDIAICMLGINNGLISENVQKDINIQHIKKKYSFKVLNLILLLKLHIQTMIEKNAYANTNNNDQIKQMEFAIYLYNTKQFEKSINLINKILEKEPFNKLAYSHQIMNYFGDDNIENDILAYKMVLDALDGIDDGLDDYYTYFINGFNYLISNNKPIDELKQRLLKKEQFVVDEVIYNMIKPFLTDSEKHILLNRRNLVNEKAEKDFAYRNSLLLKYPNIETYNLYKSIVKKLVDNNIKVICMQYPIISLQPLKNELKDTNYYYNITFISNEFNFKSKLKSINYWDLFRDQFAGDFGHCTDLGNTMIAENIVNTLENILNLKKN